jgi:hypothetical protein
LIHAQPFCCNARLIPSRRQSLLCCRSLGVSQKYAQPQISLRDRHLKQRAPRPCVGYADPSGAFAAQFDRQGERCRGLQILGAAIYAAPGHILGFDGDGWIGAQGRHRASRLSRANIGFGCVERRRCRASQFQRAFKRQGLARLDRRCDLRLRYAGAGRRSQ